MEEQSEIVSLRIPDELNDWIERQSEPEGPFPTKSDAVRYSIQKSFGDREYEDSHAAIADIYFNSYGYSSVEDFVEDSLEDDMDISKVDYDGEITPEGLVSATTKAKDTGNTFYGYGETVRRAEDDLVNSIVLGIKDVAKEAGIDLG